jgi:type I restriction enzyme S subunit
MINWKETKLGEVITLKRGYDLPQQSRINGQFPIYSSAGLSGFHNEFKVKGPGVVTGRYGTLGEVFYTESDYWPHNTTLYVKDFKGNHPKFIYYFIQTLSFNNQNDKTSVPGLNRNHLHDLIVSFPEDLPTQTRIAEILSSLDDKIELNRQMNQTLEQMAQTLFKKHFVDNIDESSQTQIGLFDFANLIGGGTPKTSVKDYWEGDIIWVSAKDVTPNDGTFLIDSERRITDSGLNNSSAKLVPTFSTIVTARGTVGKICIASEEMTISQSNYALKAKVSNADFVLFQIVKHKIEELRRNSYGTVFDTITTNTLRDIKLFTPPSEKIIQLEEELKALYFKILSNLKEIKTLTQLRDTLLPKLMSGEIDVNAVQTEKAYAEVLS